MVVVCLGAVVVVWVVVFICGQSSSFFRWLWCQGGHGLLLALGIVSQLWLVVSWGCGCRRNEATSHVVMLVTCKIACIISHDDLVEFDFSHGILPDIPQILKIYDGLQFDSVWTDKT
jgi:hypothetical protein